MKWLRRIRGAIGMGFTWAVAWGIVGMAPRWVFGWNADAPFPLIFGVLGFLGGIAFSGLLALTESSRKFEEMSLRRFAGWGAAGGLVLSAIFTKIASLEWGDVLMITPTFAAACAICAAGSLALARRALSRELPGGRVELSGLHSPNELLGVDHDAGRKRVRVDELE